MSHAELVVIVYIIYNEIAKAIGFHIGTWLVQVLYTGKLKPMLGKLIQDILKN